MSILSTNLCSPQFWLELRDVHCLGTAKAGRSFTTIGPPPAILVTTAGRSVALAVTWPVVFLGTVRPMVSPVNPPPNQSATEDAAFAYQLPAGTFADKDVGDTLTYSATLADGSALPKLELKTS